MWKLMLRHLFKIHGIHSQEQSQNTIPIGTIVFMGESNIEDIRGCALVCTLVGKNKRLSCVWQILSNGSNGVITYLLPTTSSSFSHHHKNQIRSPKCQHFDLKWHPPYKVVSSFAMQLHWSNIAKCNCTIQFLCTPIVLKSQNHAAQKCKWPWW